jgi:integrase
MVGISLVAALGRQVDIGKRSYRFETKILPWDQTAAVLARLADPNRLVIETCVATSTRISEVTGLMIKHFDPAARIVRIEQHNWRMDIDTPKTEGSKRVLALGDLCDRYRDWIAKLDRRRWYRVRGRIQGSTFRW